MQSSSSACLRSHVIARRFRELLPLLQAYSSVTRTSINTQPTCIFDMSRDYIAMLSAVISVLMSTEASGQPTVDDDGICDDGLPTSDQVANLIRKGMEKVLASNQQHSACTPTTEDPLKQALVSALECECQCSIFCST